MKITSFNPFIMTANADELVSLYEDLGFKTAHHSVNMVNNKEINNYTMRDDEGHQVDISDMPGISHDMVSIRVNVRDFKEAYNFFMERGFKNIDTDNILNTGSAHIATLLSPSRFLISIAEHIRKDED